MWSLFPQGLGGNKNNGYYYLLAVEALIYNSMNATEYLHFNVPTQEVGKKQEGESKLIPHPDNGMLRLPSSTKLISRLTGSGSSD